MGIEKKSGTGEREKSRKKINPSLTIHIDAHSPLLILQYETQQNVGHTGDEHLVCLTALAVFEHHDPVLELLLEKIRLCCHLLFWL